MTEKRKSRALQLAFNERELSKFLKKAKNGRTFLYTVGLGFTNGFMLLADNAQLTAFMKKEFLIVQNMWFREYSKIETDVIADIHNNHVSKAVFPVQITNYLYQGDRELLNKVQYRIFRKGDEHFYIDSSFLNLIKDQHSENLEYFTNSHMTALLITTKDGEFVAYFLGIRTDDGERKFLNQQVELLEAEK